MDLNEIMIFVRVVKAGSIRAAAEQLGIPKSTVSRKLISLEKRLDARLIQRTTRKLGLTDIGRIYFDHTVRIVMDIEDAEREVTDQRKVPRGLLRVTTPLNVAFLSNAFSDYLSLYQDVRLELSANTRVVDLIEEGFDAGIRVGRLEDSSLIAKLLGYLDWSMVASTKYLNQRGHPRSPSDLKQHDCLLFGYQPSITLTCKGHTETTELTPKLLVTNVDILKTAAMTNDLGIALLPSILCTDALLTGKLERVLTEWVPPSTPVHIVYPSKKHLSPTLRSFIDHMAHIFIDTPIHRQKIRHHLNDSHQEFLHPPFTDE